MTSRERSAPSRPARLQPAGHPLVPFHWSNRRLWAMDLPVERVPTRQLAWHLDLPLWSTRRGARCFDLCPSEVISDPEKYDEHARHIKAADLRYPLDLVPVEGRHVIADGVHRLAKAHILEQPQIAVRRLPEARLREIYATEETDD